MSRVAAVLFSEPGVKVNLKSAEVSGRMVDGKASETVRDLGASLRLALQTIEASAKPTGALKPVYLDQDSFFKGSLQRNEQAVHFQDTCKVLTIANARKLVQIVTGILRIRETRPTVANQTSSRGQLWIHLVRVSGEVR